MKVLHVTNAFPYDDYSSYGIFVKEQINSLSELGLENEIIFINSRKFGFSQYFSQINEVRKAINIFRPDIVHCHHEFSIIACLPAFFFKRIPIVLSLLGDISKRSLMNRVFFGCVKFLPTSIIYKSSISQVGSNCYYLPNGVDTDFFQPVSKLNARSALKLDSNRKYVLFVSASLGNPIKRYDKFLAIISELRKTDNEVEGLVMSGVERKLVPLYFNAADLLLLTSDHEGSPNAIKEAMSCNIPIVSTDVGNVRRLFQTSHGLFVHSLDDFDGLVSSCRKALSLKNSNGRDAIFGHGLDMKSVATGLADIYRKTQL